MTCQPEATQNGSYFKWNIFLFQSGSRQGDKPRALKWDDGERVCMKITFRKAWAELREWNKFLWLEAGERQVSLLGPQQAKEGAVAEAWGSFPRKNMYDLSPQWESQRAWWINTTFLPPTFVFIGTLQVRSSCFRAWSIDVTKYSGKGGKSNYERTHCHRVFSFFFFSYIA